MVSRETRGDALEVALVARVLLDPLSLRGFGQIPLTPQASALVGSIIAQPSVAAIDSTLLVSDQDERQWPGLTALARQAGSVTVQDVAACGSLPLIVDLLRDVRLQAALGQRRRSA